MKTRALFSILLSLFIMNQTFTNPIESDSFTAKNGKTVTVHFIQHSSFYFTYDDITVYVDPVKYDRVDYSTLPKADLILITHDHYDHFDAKAIDEISKPNMQLYCNGTVYEALKAGVQMKNGERVTFKKVTNNEYKYIDIEAVTAYNTTEGRDIYHPKERDNGYVITFGGSKIYISGDCEIMPEMKELTDIDVAFLPINQPYTMTVEQAITAAKMIKPKILYPIHYSETDLSGLSVLKKEGIEVRIFKM